MTRTILSTGLTAAAMSLFLIQQPDVTRIQTQSTYVFQSSSGYFREMMYLDTNGDMMIGPKELAAGQQMASMLLMLDWEDCDRNGDGIVSPPEFQLTADGAMQALRESQTEPALEAENALANAITMKLLLQQLSQEEQYAAEIAALRAEIADLNDDEAVATYVIQYSTRYPRLTPIVRTWVRYYPVQSRLHRVVKPYRPHHYYRKPAEVRPVHPTKARPHPGQGPIQKGPKPMNKQPKPRPHKP